MKKLLSVLFVFHVVPVAVASIIGGVDISTDGKGLVTVTYSLDSDAIVTADFRSNGVSLGGAKQWSLSGDVNRLVFAGNDKTLTWNAKQDAPETELTDVTVELKAWAESDAPDYMVADLLKTTDCRIRYYPSADFLPGGIVSNEHYRSERTARHHP